jgi:hypothetical protein
LLVGRHDQGYRNDCHSTRDLTSLSGDSKGDPVPRILIVEDDDHIRTALRLMFEGEGFVVDDAPTGEIGRRDVHRMSLRRRRSST